MTAEGRTAEVGPPQVPAAPVMSSVTNQSALASWTDPGQCAGMRRRACVEAVV